MELSFVVVQMTGCFLYIFILTFFYALFIEKAEDKERVFKGLIPRMLRCKSHGDHLSNFTKRFSFSLVLKIYRFNTDAHYVNILPNCVKN